MGDLKFVGSGEKDVDLNTSGTNPGDLGSGGGASDDFKFAGDGAKDVWNSTASTKSGESQSKPSGEGEIDFVGGSNV